MTDDIYTRLAWLLPAPDDLSARLRALTIDRDGSDLGVRVRALAGYALDPEQLRKLARTMATLKETGASLAPLAPYRLAVLSNSTTDLLLPSLVATAARHGLDLSVHAAEYGQVMQDALDSGSELYRFEPDAILVAVDHHGLPLEVRPGRVEEADAAVDAALDYLNRVRGAIHAQSNSLCILQTVSRPPETLFGSLDFMLPGTMRNMVEATNRRLAASLDRSRDLLLDVAGLAETVGLAHWHDPALWNMGKIPFDMRFVPLYAEHLFRLVMAAQGRSRRVLALDLDNTLWGGVIGDDGLEGIAVSQGDAVGEAHLAVQRTALDLRARGILLAVSSKNDEDQARKPFRDHAEMLLREHHLTVIQANWDDKASNLEAIARRLDLGLDSIAFLDDNPMERDLVRTLSPKVAVPEMPSDPALFARTLLASGCFESVSMTEEDQARADLYQRNAKRAELQHAANNIDEYLASLGMEIHFRPFDAVGRTRITQLINKSNQFNLTTRRYTESEVVALETDPAIYALQVRLTDIFGDNGMICVVIARAGVDGGTWEIDTWLMSCRVLKRRVEEAVLAELAKAARATGARRLVGTYVPTARNGIVAEHYDRLGFQRLDDSDPVKRLYVLDLERYETPALPIKVAENQDASRRIEPVVRFS